MNDKVDQWKHAISRMLTLGLNQEQIRQVGQTDHPYTFQQEHRIRSLLKQNSQIKEQTLRSSLLENEYIIIDTETTGFKPENGDEIISLAAVKVIKGKISPTVFFSYIRPTKDMIIPEHVKNLTGIDETVLKGTPLLEEVIDDFLEFIGRSFLIGFHISHDLLFLNDFLSKKYQIKMNKSGFEIQKVLNSLIPDQPFLDLDQALHYYSIPVFQRHHALEDSFMTAKLWIKVLHECKDKGIDSLFDLYSKIAQK